MLIVLALILLLVGSTVLFHLEALRTLSAWLNVLKGRPGLFAFVLMLSLLFVHLIEILLFAGGFAWIERVNGTGELVGTFSPGWRDYFYFSGVVYTTVGFGDLVPRGPLRILTSLEALTGALMVAWSASFTFLQMQRSWKGFD